jgi:hypothetical protein
VVGYTWVETADGSVTRAGSVGQGIAQHFSPL